MNIIDLETPAGAEKLKAPQTDDQYPFWITEYGRTFPDIPCYQIRMNSDISCIQYVISGSGVIVSDNSVYEVGAGDTFLLREGENHIYYSNPDNKFERIWINFHGALANSLIDIYALRDTTVFKNTDSLGLLHDIHEKCRSETDPQRYKNETACVFLRLIQFLSRHKNDAPETESTVNKIRLYISRHITENIKLTDISQALFLSPEHIIRIFKKEYGITPHRYILESKLRIAMIMLRTTDFTIEEISNRLGFSDPHHFSAQFNSFVGKRPSAYRKQFCT